MPRESRACCASVIQARLADLEAHVAGLLQAGGADACPACGCQMGGHLVVLPGDLIAAALLDRAGWVECESCDTSCGTWGLTIPLW